jgi:PPOX class probable F420-dependent enzyme
MSPELDDSTRAFIRQQRVAHLATASAAGQPLVVPICYVFDGECIYSPLDEKPKSVAAHRLKRVRNIAANPRVSLVIDRYSEDWSQLAYLIISGLAEIIEPDELHHNEHERIVALLREKYPQYETMAIERQPLIKIHLVSLKRWQAQS